MASIAERKESLGVDVRGVTLSGWEKNKTDNRCTINNYVVLSLCSASVCFFCEQDGTKPPVVCIPGKI